MKEAKGSGLYNVVVIGAGTAGLVTAAGTASLGGRVALIDPTWFEVARKAGDQYNKKRLTPSLEKLPTGSTKENGHECLEDVAVEMDGHGPRRDRRDRRGEIPSRR